MTYEVTFPGHRTEVFNDEWDAASSISGSDDYIDGLEIDADENIDECYGRIEIAGQTFWASAILRELNEDLYYQCEREYRENYAENEQEWIAQEIRDLCDGGTAYFDGGITVLATEDEESENTDDKEEEEESTNLAEDLELIF